MAVLNQTIDGALNHYAHQVAMAFNADVFSFYGGISPHYFNQFRQEVETLCEGNAEKTNSLVFFIYTPGGSVEIAETMVNVLRHYYCEIYFVVPDQAMSAGTILCMAGDKIYMDYSSALGPIDPQ